MSRQSGFGNEVKSTNGFGGTGRHEWRPQGERVGTRDSITMEMDVRD